jgi:large subunit ribosomal protein L35
MPKMKTHRGAAKRFKRTGTGSLKRGHAYTSHLAPRKTTKQKRHLKKSGLVHKSDYKRIKNMLVYMK